MQYILCRPINRALRASALTALLIALATVTGVAFATIAENYDIASTVTATLTGPDNICKQVSNNHASGKGLYVPANTTTEWQSFVAHPPAGVTIGSCCVSGGAFTAVANLPESKGNPLAVLLANGTPIVCSGWQGGNYYSSRCDVYDPATNVWTQRANFPQPKDFMAYASTPSGKVLACAGHPPASVTNRCDLYDPATNAWMQAASLPEVKYELGSARLPDGRPFFCGGYHNSSSSYVSRCDAYNEDSNTWTQMPSMPAAMVASGVTLPDGRILMLGDRFGLEMSPLAYVYTPSTGSWSAVAAGPGYFLRTVVALATGQVLACGGHDYNFNYTNRCDLFNPATNTWSQTVSFPAAQLSMSAVALPDGRALFCAGATGLLNSFVNSCYIFTPTNASC